MLWIKFSVKMWLKSKSKSRHGIGKTNLKPTLFKYMKTIHSKTLKIGVNLY